MGMTDREKAIQGLRELRAHFRAMAGVASSNQGRKSHIESAEIIADAIDLLTAQEPVEPVVDKNISTGESDDPWGRLFFCGACGRRINEKYNPDEDDKYCKHCGRPVKWE